MGALPIGQLLDVRVCTARGRGTFAADAPQRVGALQVLRHSPAVCVGLRSLRQQTESAAIQGRAFDPRAAAMVALLFAGMLLAVGVLNRVFGANGTLAGAIVGGFFDGHATSGSIATLAQEAAIPATVGYLGVVLAVSANTVTKIVLAGMTGGMAYCSRLAPSLVAMLAALWAGVYLL